MPRGIYTNIECDSKKEAEFQEQPHQTQVKKFFVDRGEKGILLYHKLGSGKTCTSIVIADELLDKEVVNKVFVLTPGSLRKNWIDEYCTKCGLKSKRLRKRFIFVTYNYHIDDIIETFDGSLVIIDEFHNFIRGVKNRSKTVTKLYNTLLASNCRIILLSATPVIKNIDEWPLIGNLLKPGFFKDSREDEIEKMRFKVMFKQERDGSLSLVPQYFNIFAEHLKGIVSYFPGAGDEYYPRVTHNKPFMIPMTMDQAGIYCIIIAKEDTLSKIKPVRAKYKSHAEYLEAMGVYIMAKKRIMSRSASNFRKPHYTYDEQRNIWTYNRAESEDYVAIMEEDDHGEPMIKTRVRKPDKDESEGGWITKDTFADNKLQTYYSPKYAKIIENIKEFPKQKHVIFTFYKTMNGAYMFKYLLNKEGITAEVYSGDQDETERNQMLKKFNDVENREGGFLQIIIITDAGSEGINILEARHIHIVESSTDEYRIKQAIGRVVRYKSHINMDKADQTVNTWRYFSTIPAGMPSSVSVELDAKDIKLLNREDKSYRMSLKINENIQGIDEILYREGRILGRTLEKFDELLIKNSI